jgi:hypothetical protein
VAHSGSRCSVSTASSPHAVVPGQWQPCALVRPLGHGAEGAAERHAESLTSRTLHSVARTARPDAAGEASAGMERCKMCKRAQPRSTPAQWATAVRRADSKLSLAVGSSAASANAAAVQRAVTCEHSAVCTEMYYKVTVSAVVSTVRTQWL